MPGTDRGGTTSEESQYTLHEMALTGTGSGISEPFSVFIL